jgi:SAM-dependent methyltransferase
MTDPPADLVPHWDTAYGKGIDGVSWTEPEATVSLAFIDQLDLPTDTPVIDVGGGASPLTANLLDRGFTHLSVLDISHRALDLARRHIGRRGDDVTWIRADLRDWHPARPFGLWHDRAVLHFLTDAEDQKRYGDLIASALAPGAHAIIATFAPDGPDRCSGLPVVRYSAAGLSGLLGPRFELLDHRHETHHTPSGTPQAFTWVMATRRAD